MTFIKRGGIIGSGRALPVALTLLLFFAAVLRFANLATLPGGLHNDEAVEGLDALDILDGARPLFLTVNSGREPLNAYLVALSVAGLGRTPAAVRLPSVLASTLTVLGVYLFTASLTNRRIGLLAATICTFTVWPILLGRLGTRPALLPLCLTFGLWLGVRGWQTGRYRYWALSGVIMGLAFYTYTPIRVIIFVLPLWALVLITIGQGRRLWPGAFIFGAVLLLVVMPVGIYVLSNWAVVMGRSGDVSVVSPAYSTRDNLANVVRQTYIVLQMFVMPGRGDPNWRHNISGRAVFDLLMAVPFVAGLGLMVVARHKLGRRLRLALWLCGLWVGVGLMPTILSRAIPHFLRACAILPVLFIWPASGLDWLHHQLAKRTHPALALALASGLLLGSAAVTTNDYLLNRYLAFPEVAAWFESPKTDIALEVNRFLGVGWQGDGLAAAPNRLPPERQVWVDPHVWPDHPAVDFLVPLAPGATPALRLYDPATALPVAELAGEVLFIVAPGMETELLWLIPANYVVTVEDGPRTPDSTLREATLPYRRVIARAQSAKPAKDSK